MVHSQSTFLRYLPLSTCFLSSSRSALHFRSHTWHSRLNIRMASSKQRSPQPVQFPTSGYEVIESSVPMEEELIPNYKADNYFPVRLGEIFNGRYQTVGKLGYGASSTVWLCRDLQEHGHVALKVYVNSAKVQREIPMYDHVNTLEPTRPGRVCIRKLLDHFEVDGPHGRHACLVHQASGMSLADLKIRAKDQVFSKQVLRVSIRQLLLALDFLHRDARLIHTDCQPNNLLQGIRPQDEKAFSEYEQDELNHPIPRKSLPDRTIYLSRPFPLTYGPPLLSDLGEARSGEQQNTEDVMSTVYRAPEVLLCMHWSYPIDIWSVAMVVWDLFEPKRLFEGRGADGQYSIEAHLAEMVAILGPPPSEFLNRSEFSHHLWDDHGNWRNVVPIPDISLEQLEHRLEGDDKDGFLDFIRAMITWLPEKRLTAEELVYHPWLMEGLYRK